MAKKKREQADPFADLTWDDLEPYAINCKHGVAVVLEYLEQVGKDRRIPKASEGDERLALLEGRGEDELLDEEEPGLPEPVRMEIEPFLQDKSKAENLIARVSPSAYEEAARYLRQAGAVLAREGKQQEWTRYLQDLREAHARKRRLIEVLDPLTRKPILAKKTRS